VPLFAGLDEALRERLAARARAVHLTAGEWLFREGEEGDCLFVVRAGRLEIVSEVADAAILRVLGRGEALGELALLTGSPRSASVRAARDSDVIAIDREPFEQLFDETPELSRSISRTLAAQLRKSRGALDTKRPRPTTVALVPLSEGVRADEIGARLGDALALYGSVATLDVTVAPRPAAGAELAAYGPVLDRAETASDIVVLVAGTPDEPHPWTEFCLQQADRVLGLTHGGDVPQAVLERPELRGCDLVAVAVAAGSESLSGWAQAFDPIETHALPRAALEEGLARMARRLTGNSVGVVLSGGGARALSHIGVIEELLAAGVRIDRVAGVSMGAYIGAMLAAGMGAEEIDARCYEEWVRRRPLSDFTLPRHALIRGGRVEAMLERTFGTLAIEELERSFFSASGELRSGALVVHRWGRLVDRVGESIALPIIGPPVRRGRQILVDGSLVDNLPVAAMAELGEGPLIAVDVKVTMAPGGSRSPTVTPVAAGKRQGRRYALGSDRPPPFGETLTRVLLLGSSKTSDAARRYADLTIEPRNDGVGLLEFHQIDRARAAGREAAREALENAPASLFS
jgi:predicted acylesterase/phospholipase RssA/CRP-like cAMP-binding protein